MIGIAAAGESNPRGAGSRRERLHVRGPRHDCRDVRIVEAERDFDRVRGSQLAVERRRLPGEVVHVHRRAPWATLRSASRIVSRRTSRWLAMRKKMSLGVLPGCACV